MNYIKPNNCCEKCYSKALDDIIDGVYRKRPEQCVNPMCECHTHHSENTECCEKCKIFEGLDGFPNCKSSSCPCHHPKEDWEKEICKILLKYDTTEKELVNVRKQYVDELLGYIRTHFTHTATLRWKIEEKRREISYEGAPKTLNAENQNYRKIGYTEALDDIVALLKSDMLQ